MKHKKNKLKTIRFRCTEEEAELIYQYAQNSQSVSEYIRSRIFKRGSSVLNPIEFIRVLDEICIEMKRVGNNINQFAKYANQRKDITDDMVIQQFTKQLTFYVKVHKQLEITYRKIMTL